MVSTIVYLVFFQAEDGIRDLTVTGVQTCALPISGAGGRGDHPRPSPAGAGHHARAVGRPVRRGRPPARRRRHRLTRGPSSLPLSTAPRTRDRAPRHGPIPAVRGTFQSVPGAPARPRSALTPEESHASTSPLSCTVPRGRRRATRCRLRRQPAPTEEAGRPARDRRQRPGAGYELHLPAVPELLVRHEVCADCRDPHGGPAAAAARRAAHARDPPRSLARREPARRHGAARCARANPPFHRSLDLPPRRRAGHVVYLELD